MTSVSWAEQPERTCMSAALLESDLAGVFKNSMSVKASSVSSCV